MVQPAWPEDTIRSLQLSEFDERFRRYRLSPPEAEREIIDSLRRYGQIAPVVVCLCHGEYLLIDGFKRLAAARSIKGFDTLRARAMACDERAAKANHSQSDLKQIPVSRRKWTILSTQSILHLKVDGASICSATSSAIHDDSICDLSTT